MNLSPFFNLIWKINALLILIAGVVVCGLLAFAGYTFYEDNSRRYANDVVNVEPTANASSAWRFGNFERVGGTDYIIASSYSEQNYGIAYGSSSKEASAVRNYLFINATDKSSRWLVPNNDQLFLRGENVSRFIEDETKNAPKWKMYQVVKHDSSDDERLTASDKSAIAFSDAIGLNYAEVIPEVSTVLGTEMRDDDTMLIFYTSGGENIVAEVNIPERRVTVTKELPQIQR